MTVAPATIPLKPDEQAILRILAEAPDSLDSFTICCEITPQPKIRDGRRRESRLWRERQLELTEAEIALYKAGFVAVAIPADGWNADRYVITDAGRAALAATAEEES